MKRRSLMKFATVLGLAGRSAVGRAETAIERLELDEAEWRCRLTPAQFEVLHREGTDRPGSSPLNHEKRKGNYLCAGFALPLFSSDMKYDSGTGWPSFFNTPPGAVATKTDYTLIWPRTEYHCARCGGHQGHVFDDGAAPTGGTVNHQGSPVLRHRFAVSHRDLHGRTRAARGGRRGRRLGRSGRRASGLLLATLAALVLAGCVAAPVQPPADQPLAACIERFAQSDRDIARAGARDAGEARIPGFPYLRADRFLASFAAKADAPDRFSAWIRAMGALDARARRIEIANAGGGDGGEALDACREALIAHDSADPLRRAALASSVRVPDDYLVAWRALGLYPLSSLFTSSGIRRWHAQAAQVFDTPLGQLPVRGELRRWRGRSGASMGADRVRALLDASRDALGVPRPGAADAARLFAAFAPVWEVDVAGDADRIGYPRAGPGAGVDTGHPIEFRHLAWTRNGDAVLLQLVYGVWFSARPGKDIYAGALDGLVWRVTLDSDGSVLLYDSIHACGCYHQFFPTARLRLRADLPRHGFEQPLVPQPAPPGTTPVVRLAAGTHYIERVYADDAARPTDALAVLDYDVLRRGAPGTRGLFDAHGLVPGSERGERFLLWPAGIRSPGAMRQWGRHATAFVGRRHFDDAFLLDTLFEDVP